MTEEDIDNRIGKILEILTVVYPKIKVDVIKDDPTDNRVLEGALTAKVDFVISNDKHVLKIKEFRGIKIVKPDDFH